MTVVVLAIAAIEVVVIEESLKTVVVVSAGAPVVLDPPGGGSVIVDAGDVSSNLTLSFDAGAQAASRYKRNPTAKMRDIDTDAATSCYRNTIVPDPLAMVLQPTT
ncbi:MAG: hypothetical protein GXP36_04230 [Actinobacteria bacterium]|nr:hypothetical protein [Actinomycetota bacterium]